MKQNIFNKWGKTLSTAVVILHSHINTQESNLPTWKGICCRWLWKRQLIPFHYSFKQTLLTKNATHLLFSFSIFFNLFLSTSSWAWRRVFSCLKRLFWDSVEDIWILLERSSSVAARSLSAAAARSVWDSPNIRKTYNLTFLIKHL